MESRVTAIETQLVYMESRMDATDTAVSENQIEMDNVRQELYQQNEAFMVQTHDLLNRYGEQQLLLQRLSETCARIELQLEKSQLVINSPTQFSVAICRSLGFTDARNKLYIYTTGIYKSNDQAMGSRQPTDPANPTARILEYLKRTGGSVVTVTDRRKSATATSAHARRKIHVA